MDTWLVTNLSGSIPPGGYYLIQEAVGSGGSQDLPTPDAIGNIAMSATTGKVLLCTTQTPQSGTCPTGSHIVDFVGYGSSANCYEGNGPAPAPSNTTSIKRNSNGCTDTNNNSSDFSTGTVTPRNSSSPRNNC